MLAPKPVRENMELGAWDNRWREGYETLRGVSSKGAGSEKK